MLVTNKDLFLRTSGCLFPSELGLLVGNACYPRHVVLRQRRSSPQHEYHLLFPVHIPQDSSLFFSPLNKEIVALSVIDQVNKPKHEAYSLLGNTI